jgi:hypothetical protein
MKEKNMSNENENAYRNLVWQNAIGNGGGPGPEVEQILIDAGGKAANFDADMTFLREHLAALYPQLPILRVRAAEADAAATKARDELAAKRKQFAEELAAMESKADAARAVAAESQERFLELELQAKSRLGYE